MMFKSGTVLDTPEKLLSAMNNHSHVAVYHKGQLANFGGPIQLLTEAAVKINGFYYLMENHEFRIR